MEVVSVCIPCTAAQDSLMVHQHHANHNNGLRLSLQLKRRSQHIIDNSMWHEFIPTQLLLFMGFKKGLSKTLLEPAMKSHFSGTQARYHNFLPRLNIFREVSKTFMYILSNFTQLIVVEFVDQHF